jgi:LuxR family maltose regulon positive regulatory protein
MQTAASERNSARNPVPMTKFRMPRLRGDSIAHPELLARLRHSVETNPVTLVCAPAGSGKSTLLAQLGAALSGTCAVLWVAIDDDDNDANRFYAALVQAVEPLGLTWDLDVAGLLAGVDGNGRETRAALAAYVNALCTAPASRVVIILDDLHRLDNRDVFELLESLIERLPEHVALVLGTRHEPPLPLARWRVHAEIGELSARDLRFDEAQAMLLAAARLGQELDARDVRAALKRTEGWAVGLSMLLQSRSPTQHAGGGTPLGGDSAKRTLFAYLAQEILDELPLDLQEFVLRSAVLVELNPTLCRAVTGRDDAGAVLDAIYRRGLFLTAIDDLAMVLRFHDLFRDFLEIEFARRHPDEVRSAHARAARAETVPARAIHHLLKAEQWEEALGAILRIGESLLAEGAIGAIERWLGQVPASIREGNARAHYLLGSCAALRWNWARALAELAPAAEGLTSPSDRPQRVLALFQLADALSSSGNVPGALARLDTVAQLPLDDLGLAELALQRAWCAAAQGDFTVIAPNMETFVRHAERDAERVAPIVAGRIHCMMVGLPGVVDAFEKFVALGERVRGPVGAPWHLSLHAIDAWVKLWRGDRDGMTHALERAESLYQQFGAIRLMAERIGQLKAIHSAAIGNTPLATAIARSHIQGMQVPELAAHRAAWERAYRHAFARFHWMAGDAHAWYEQYPHLVAARAPAEWPFVSTAAAVAEGQAAVLRRDWHAAIGLLQHAIRASESRRMPAIHCDPRVTLAYALLASGQRPAAWQMFDTVLEELAATRAFGVLVLESRPQLAALLDAAPPQMQHDSRIQELRRMLASWGTDPGPLLRVAAPGSGGPLDVLSEREREVLAQVAVGASNKHIARDLDLSLHTVKRHIANILAKLDCASRGQAADLYRRHTYPL